jgi:hypothetical protein
LKYQNWEKDKKRREKDKPKEYEREGISYETIDHYVNQVKTKATRFKKIKLF